MKLGENFEMLQLVKGQEFGVQGSLAIISPLVLVCFDQNELSEISL